jgi:hypothetical protein
MKFYVTERIGPKQSQTPEGLASCEDVPIARVGIDFWFRQGRQSQTRRPPEGGPFNHQVSVRREAAHIRASRFELIRMVQIFLRIGTERETFSHEASDNFCFHVCRSIRRRNRYAAVSFDRDVRRDRCYALVAEPAFAKR